MKKSTFLLVSFSLFVLISCDKQFENVPQNASALKSGQTEPDLKSAHLVQNFRAHMSGANEVPANTSEATGEVIFQLSKDSLELSYKLIVANIDNVMMSHIHLAHPGVNGKIVTWLYPSTPPMMLIPGTSNGVLADGVITKANLIGTMAGKTIANLVAEIKAGNAYVNVHTSQFGGGEIRGQIMGNVK
jgi:hypothetical protein